MFQNYLKVAIRNLLKNRANSLINIIGLAVGICSVILIYLYIISEFSYDSFQKDCERIYRVSIITSIKDKGTSESTEFVDPLAPAMKNEIPEVEQYCRISNEKAGLISNDNNHFQINAVRFADSTFFGFFSYELVHGDAKQVLNRPFTAVMTEETAVRLFGNKNPIGQTLIFNNDHYEITGLAKNPPKNSHLGFNMLLSFSSLYNKPNVYMGWNGGNQYINYVKLKIPNRPEVVNQKLSGLMWNYLNQKFESLGWKLTAYLQPLKEIHLKYDGENNARLTNIYVFSAVALLILIIACINYINLTIAGSMQRSREVGVRKVFGASKIVLIRQFVMESFFTIIISSCLSFLGLSLIMPFYKRFVGDFFSSEIFFSVQSILLFFAGTILISLIASLYPSFYLSRMTPIKAINEKGRQRFSKINLRNLLILIQFVISIGMISATLIINSQLNYIKNRGIGYQKENVLILQLNNKENREKYALLKSEIQKINGVTAVTASSGVPVNGFTSNGYLVEGKNAPALINIVDADKDFFDTYQIKVIEGRKFSDEFGLDKNSYLVNEEFVKEFGLENPIGKNVSRNNSTHKIIGIVANFNFASAYENITPLIISNFPEENSFNYLSVKIEPVNASSIIKSISSIYKNICPESPLEYTFLNDELARLYHDEDNFKVLFIYFSVLAIMISIIGLLGLTAFLLSQRRKEIGIRRVIGASTISILKLQLNDFIFLILISNIIAWPVVYYFLGKWLNDFAYRVGISWWVFFTAGGTALFITLITVSLQAIKAITANPVEALKHE